jgi:hypothetical protein
MFIFSHSHFLNTHNFDCYFVKRREEKRRTRTTQISIAQIRQFLHHIVRFNLTAPVWNLYASLLNPSALTIRSSNFSPLFSTESKHRTSKLSYYEKLWLTLWVREWMNQSINEWMNQWINESMNQWMNQWINQWIWINESMNQWINEWINEWIWINESMNQWINESMSQMNEW